MYKKKILQKVYFVWRKLVTKVEEKRHRPNSGEGKSLNFKGPYYWVYFRQFYYLKIFYYTVLLVNPFKLKRLKKEIYFEKYTFLFKQ